MAQMSEGPETRPEILVLWIGRATWVATVILLIAAAVVFVIHVHRDGWSWFPKPSEPDEPVSENLISD